MSEKAIIISSLPALGRAIASYRRAAGYTQRELSAAVGVSRVWIGELERGQLANPGFDRLLAIFNVLQIRFEIVPASDDPRSGLADFLIEKRQSYD
ncbi:hypothetical protein AGMMS49983_17500 [Clostridia bacterium]|nr:hypothetical protein AGMMS49983_17500 [Clostridia bacterium]